MTEALRKFRRLSGMERGIVCESAALIPAAWVAVRVFGFRVGAALQSQGVRSAPEPKKEYLKLAECIARLASAAAARLPFQTSCLEQSIALCWMLQRRGMNPQLRVGGRKDAEGFEAHAWVEVEGAALDCGGAEHLHFVPFGTRDVSLETRTD